MRADVYDARVLIRGDLFFLDFPAVIVAAWFRDEDLDDFVTASVVYDYFSPGAHGSQERIRRIPWFLDVPDLLRICGVSPVARFVY